MPRRTRAAIAAGIAVVAALGCLSAQAQTHEAPRVDASYVVDPKDPAGERVLQGLKLHLERQALKSLAPGQKLSVEILSVYRAGHRSWTPGNDGVRVVTDSTPARIGLAFRLEDAAGGQLAHGTRSLRSPDFFIADRGGDPLRFEKQLLDEWLAREFAPRQ